MTRMPTNEETKNDLIFMLKELVEKAHYAGICDSFEGKLPGVDQSVRVVLTDGTLFDPAAFVYAYLPQGVLFSRVKENTITNEFEEYERVFIPYSQIRTITEEQEDCCELSGPAL